MGRRDWPAAIDPNQFTFAKLDATIAPTEVKITTWSNVFGSGGRVTADAIMPDGKRIELAAISVDRNGPVTAEREHLQRLVDDWCSDDLGAAWANAIADATKKVRDYYSERAAEYGLTLSEGVTP